MGKEYTMKLNVINEETNEISVVGDYLKLEDIQGVEVEKEINLGEVTQGGFGLNNSDAPNPQVCRTALLKNVNLNGTVKVSLPKDANIKYQVYYGNNPPFSGDNPMKQLFGTAPEVVYVDYDEFTILAKHIRVKFVAYDNDGNRINITPAMCEGISFSTPEFKGVNLRRKDKTIRVASSIAPVEEKAYADYVCDGVNDEVEINQALQDVNDMNGGKVLLSSGVFFIDNFNLDDDGIYRAISVPGRHGLTTTIQGQAGMTQAGGGTNGNIVGTCIDVSDAAYEALSADTTEQYEILGQIDYSPKELPTTVLYLKDIRFRTPDNQKPLIFIDLINWGRATLEHVYGYAYKDVVGKYINPAVKGLIGVRMLNGANFGCENNYTSCGMNGFYEGWQVGSEGVLMLNCSAIYNVYGYTFGNYEWSAGFVHPIVMIGCCDERNVNMPLFKNNGWDMDGQGKQSVTMIAFRVERKLDGTPGGAVDKLAMEEESGMFYGDITFTVVGNELKNAVNIPFFESGHGKNFKVRNLAHALSGELKDIVDYAPNNFQQYYDTKAKRMLYYMDGQWFDSNDIAVDLTEEGEESV